MNERQNGKFGNETPSEPTRQQQQTGADRRKDVKEVPKGVYGHTALGKNNK